MSVTSEVLSWILEYGCRKGDWKVVQAVVECMEQPVTGAIAKLVPVAIALCTLDNIDTLFASHAVYTTLVHLLPDMPKHIKTALGINVLVGFCDEYSERVDEFAKSRFDLLLNEFLPEKEAEYSDLREFAMSMKLEWAENCGDSEIQSAAKESYSLKTIRKKIDTHYKVSQETSYLESIHDLLRDNIANTNRVSSEKANATSPKKILKSPLKQAKSPLRPKDFELPEVKKTPKKVDFDKLPSSKKNIEIDSDEESTSTSQSKKAALETSKSETPKKSARTPEKKVIRKRKNIEIEEDEEEYVSDFSDTTQSVRSSPIARSKRRTGKSPASRILQEIESKSSLDPVDWEFPEPVATSSKKSQSVSSAESEQAVRAEVVARQLGIVHKRPVSDSSSSRRRNWTEEEEGFLLRGIKEFGVGKWKQIHQRYFHKSTRSTVDLKDKYRNLVKYNQI